MNHAAIENALGQRLAAMASVPPIVWPAKDAIPAKPYLVFQHAATSKTDPTMQGELEISDGVATVTVVTTIGAFATEANEIADAVASHFPKGLRLAIIGGGSIVITKPSETTQPFRDGPDWRQPVRINYTSG